VTADFILPFDPRQRALSQDLAELKHGLRDFRDALRNVNDAALNDTFGELLSAADKIIEEHLRQTSSNISNDIANLRSLFARSKIPREDPDLGVLPGLTALRSTRGNILADFDAVLDAAKALGNVPTDPSLELHGIIEMSRSGREGQLAALERRLAQVESDLDKKIAPEGRPEVASTPQQTMLVNYYVRWMKIELLLAKLETIKELVDLKGLGRAIAAIGELTADFVATVGGLRGKVTSTLKQATKVLQPLVRRVVTGFKTLVGKGGGMDLTATGAPEVDIQKAEDKLREARLFLDKMVEEERPLSRDKEAFNRYLNAFLRAGMTVWECFYAQQNPERDKKVKDWRERWKDGLASENKALYEFMQKNWGREVHAQSTALKVKTERRIIDDVHVDKTGRFETIRAPGTEPSYVENSEEYHFTIEKVDRKVTEVCGEYLALLDRMVAEFKAAAS
jgi:hypothetical protein